MLSNREKLLEVVDRIMTDMFFIFPDMDDDGEQLTEGSPAEDCMQVGIHFNTDFYLHFEIDRELLAEMASNFMGLAEDDIDEEKLESMATETANIIGGNYLVKIDPDSEYSLSIPEIIDTSISEEDVPWEICYVTEGRVMRICPVTRT